MSANDAFGLDTVVGRTITRAAVDRPYGCIALTLDDGRVVVFEATPSYEGTADLEAREPNGAYELRAVGAITEEEYARRQAEARARNERETAARNDARDRAEYERLRAKYGDWKTS